MISEAVQKVQSWEDAKTRAIRERHAHRLFNPITRQYLHLSGQGETPNTFYSWSGYPHQARTLEQRAAERGEDWPYIEAPLQEDERPEHV